MNSIMKEARRDAKEAAAAQMSYGQGAGTRRKLIQSAVEYKADHIPGYASAFDEAFQKQDITKHIKSAKRSRATKDVGAVTSKNVKALARGDRNGMSAPVVVAVLAVAVAHQTGYDKKIIEYGRRKSQDVRGWLKEKL